MTVISKTIRFKCDACGQEAGDDTEVRGFQLDVAYRQPTLGPVRGEWAEIHYCEACATVIARAWGMVP